MKIPFSRKGLNYNVCMLEMFLSEVRRQRLLRAGDRVGAAVSGGADSVALLRLLLEARTELGIVPSVVHINHGIRGAEADQDQRFVAALAAQHGLEFFCSSFDAPGYARTHKLSLEAAGRAVRYQCFHQLLRAGKLTRVATAHTRDDQAETVLLRLLRGAWTRGLAGIYPALREDSHPLRENEVPGRAIIRPLLSFSRESLREYLRGLRQPWREDASNQDTRFARNRVRHELLPLLRRQFNPAVERALGETAELARAEEEYWSGVVEKLLPELLSPLQPDDAGLVLRADVVLEQPLAVQRRALRAAAARLTLNLDFDQTEAILKLLAGSSASSFRRERLELPQGFAAVLRGRELSLRAADPGAAEARVAGYEYVLPIPGKVAIPALGGSIQASLLQPGDARSAFDPDRLLDPALLPPALRVRNWRPGDRFWPARTKAPRKVKELLQRRHIVHPRKAFWPVLVCGEEIIWIPGFAVAERFQPRKPGLAVLAIEQVGLGEEGIFGP